MMARYMVPSEAENFLTTLIERLFAEPSKKAGVTLADFMPSGLRGQSLEESLKQQPVNCALLASLFAPRGRGRLPDGFATAKLLNSIYQKQGMRRLHATVLSLQRRVEEKVGAATFTLKTQTPLLVEHTGPLGLPTFPLHPLWGIPFVPARVVKGALRGYLMDSGRKDEAERLCGTPKKRGEAVFFDAYPVKPADMKVGCEIFCAHNWLYHEGGAPTDWHEPRILLFGSIPAGVRIRFAVAGQGDIAQILEEALLKRGIGARRALGYGHFAQETGG